MSEPAEQVHIEAAKRELAGGHAAPAAPDDYDSAKQPGHMLHGAMQHVDTWLQQEAAAELAVPTDTVDDIAASPHAGQEQLADHAQAREDAYGAANEGPGQAWQAPGAQTVRAHPGWDREWPWWMVPPPPPPPPLPAFLSLPPSLWRDAWVSPHYS